MSSQIQPHDVVAETGWLDLGTLADRGTDSTTVTGGLILSEGPKIEGIWVDLSSRPFLQLRLKLSCSLFVDG